MHTIPQLRHIPLGRQVNLIPQQLFRFVRLQALVFESSQAVADLLLLTQYVLVEYPGRSNSWNIFGQYCFRWS